jgi:hypothetical protein
MIMGFYDFEEVHAGAINITYKISGKAGDPLQTGVNGLLITICN